MSFNRMPKYYRNEFQTRLYHCGHGNGKITGISPFSGLSSSWNHRRVSSILKKHRQLDDWLFLKKVCILNENQFWRLHEIPESHYLDTSHWACRFSYCSDKNSFCLERLKKLRYQNVNFRHFKIPLYLNRDSQNRGIFHGSHFIANVSQWVCLVRKYSVW